MSVSSLTTILSLVGLTLLLGRADACVVAGLPLSRGLEYHFAIGSNITTIESSSVPSSTHSYFNTSSTPHPTNILSATSTVSITGTDTYLHVSSTSAASKAANNTSLANASAHSSTITSVHSTAISTAIWTHSSLSSPNSSVPLTSALTTDSRSASSISTAIDSGVSTTATALQSTRSGPSSTLQYPST